MSEAHAGRAALDQIDRILAARPMRDGHALKSATQSLSDFRDRYVEHHRRDGGSRHRSALERVNSVISVVMAAQFPLGEVPWGELEKARGWLDEVVREDVVQ